MCSEFVAKGGETLDLQRDLDRVGMQVDALHKQLDDTGLLGGEELVPELIELDKRGSYLPFC